MKRLHSFQYWLLGTLMILFVLLVFVLQYPGYIYYFDASGSFDIRRPFDQYLFTYTPYDGVEVGIKNRLPIISIIAAVYYLFQPILQLSKQDIIKVGYVLLFLGAYTAFYLVLPKFYRFFIAPKDADEKEKERELNPLLRVVLSLLYVIVPFFTFRLTMLHLFYLTTFYPLISYIYLKIVSSDKVYLRNLLLFGTLVFFGFSYANVLPYYLLTFLVIGLPFLFTAKTKKAIAALLLNIILAAGIVLLVNLYWIVPYFLKGAPSPGYVVTDNMITTLSPKSDLQNVLLDTSEWFMGQGEKVRVFVADNQYMLLAQLAGVVLFYVYVLQAWFKTSKKSLTVAIILMLLLVLGITAKESPLFQCFYNNLVYYPFGWLFREPNRIRFLFAFWTFLFFSLSLAKVSVTGAEKKTVGAILSICVAVILYLIYAGPWFMNSLSFLKPTILPDDTKQIATVLKNEQNYSFLQRYPYLGDYKLSWAENKFYLADSLNYKYFPYLLGRPSTQPGGMVPSKRTKESYLSEMVLNSALVTQKEEILAKYGIDYVLIDKSALPLYTSGEFAGESTQILNSEFVNSPLWESAYTGKNYTLLRSKNTKINPLEFTNQTLITAEPLSILDKLDYSSLQNMKLVLQHYDTEELPANATILVGQEVDNYALDYLTLAEQKKFESYPYDFTNKYGYEVDWGKASTMDKGGAEFSAILRHYSIPVFQYLSQDKVAYSTAPLKENSTVASLSYKVASSCADNCAVFAKVLYSELGGTLKISVDGKPYTVETRSNQKSGFYWVPLARNAVIGNKNVAIEIENQQSFAAVGSFVIIPEPTYSEIRTRVNSHKTIIVEQGMQQLPITTSSQNVCTSNSTYYDSIIPHVAVDGFCDVSTDMRLKQFQNEFLYVDKQTGKMQFANSISVVEGFQGEIWFFSRVDLVLWVLFTLTYVAIVVFAELILLKHVV